MVEEWIKNTKSLTGPSLREKSILLVKLMQYVEKRFPDLNTQFLELVNFVYRYFCLLAFCNVNFILLLLWF